MVLIDEKIGDYRETAMPNPEVMLVEIDDLTCAEIWISFACKFVDPFVAIVILMMR
jgi:hypothetical protein